VSCSAETAPSGSGQHLPACRARRGRRRRPVHHARHRGFDTDTAVGGLTAFSPLQVGGLLALPILALPAILAGAPASPGLIHTALLGIAGLVLFAAFGVIVIRTERALAVLGRAAQRLWNWVTGGR